jgi:integrase
MAPQITSKAMALSAAPGRHRVDKCLYLQVDPSGSRRWVFRFTSPETRRANEKSLGSVKDVDLHAAKRRAEKLRALVAEGIDPVLSAKAERQRLEREAVTFKIALDRYAEAFAKKTVMGEHVAILHRHASLLMPLSLANIDTPIVERALAKIYERFPRQARRALGLVESVLNFAKVKGWRTGDNPAAWKGTFSFIWDTPRPGPGHRALPYDDIPPLFAVIGQRLPTATALALQFLVLNASRTGEVLGAQWHEIDLPARTWNIPGPRMKGRRPHTVPLSDAAIEILQQARTEFGHQGHIFKGMSKSRLSDRALEAFLHATLQVRNASVHGMRSAFRDWAGDKSEAPREVCEAALAHKVLGVEGAYRRGSALEKRRVLMQDWGRYCTSRTGDHVIPLALIAARPLEKVD